MPDLTGKQDDHATDRGYDAIMKIRLSMNPIIMALGLMGIAGAICAALSCRASIANGGHDDGDTLGTSHDQSRDAEPAERGIEERIEALRELERQLQTATARQIIGLYEQLRKHMLEPFGLTESEREIALASIAGASNADIAARLHLSQSTVKHRLSSVFKKTGTASRHELRSKVLERLRALAEDPRA